MGFSWEGVDGGLRNTLFSAKIHFVKGSKNVLLSTYVPF